MGSILPRFFGLHREPILLLCRRHFPGPGKPGSNFTRPPSKKPSDFNLANENRRQQPSVKYPWTVGISYLRTYVFVPIPCAGHESRVPSRVESSHPPANPSSHCQIRPATGHFTSGLATLPCTLAPPPALRLGLPCLAPRYGYSFRQQSAIRILRRHMYGYLSL